MSRRLPAGIDGLGVGCPVTAAGAADDRPEHHREARASTEPATVQTLDPAGFTLLARGTDQDLQSLLDPPRPRSRALARIALDSTAARAGHNQSVASFGGRSVTDAVRIALSSRPCRLLSCDRCGSVKSSTSPSRSTGPTRPLCSAWWRSWSLPCKPSPC